MIAQGYSVLRFWNTDVLKQLDSVCQTILAALEGAVRLEVTAPDLRYFRETAMIEISPHRLAALATSPQRGEERASLP